MQLGTFELGTAELGGNDGSGGVATEGFEVLGEINVTFTHIAGTVHLSGSFNCEGEVGVTFTLPTTSSFEVFGEIVASFYMRAGQQSSCISGLDTPLAGPPNNAVH